MKINNSMKVNSEENNCLYRAKENNKFINMKIVAKL